MGPKKTLPGKAKVKKAAKAKKNELKGKENGLQKKENCGKDIEEEVDRDVVEEFLGVSTVPSRKVFKNGYNIAPVYSTEPFLEDNVLDSDTNPTNDSILGTNLALPPAVSTVVSSTGLSVPAYQPHALNMRVRNDMESVKKLVREFARGHLFRYTKFWDESFGIASKQKGKLPFNLSRSINMSKEAVLEGWDFYAKIMQRAHTDHRNNVIKKLKQLYMGTCLITG